MSDKSSEHPGQPNGPDFSGIDSLAKAEGLYRQGQLERLFLLPEMFGGQDVPQNVVFVPVGIGSVKQGIDQNIVAPLAATGKVTQYKATPEYSGRSFIPIAIEIVASIPGQFASSVNIWGEALRRS